MKFKAVNPEFEFDPLEPMLQAFNKLPEEEQQEIRNKISGNTNRIIDPELYKGFVETASYIKMFMDSHSVGKYEFDADVKNGVVKVKFKEINFKWAEELKSLGNNINVVTLGLDSKGMINLNIEVDAMVELGGKK